MSPMLFTQCAYYFIFHAEKNQKGENVFSNIITWNTELYNLKESLSANRRKAHLKVHSHPKETNVFS